MEPIITEDSEKIIINLLQKCQLDAEKLEPIHFKDVKTRVLYYSGISRKKLETIIGRYSSRECTKNHCVDFDTHVKILKSLLYFYEDKLHPAFKSLFEYTIDTQPATCEINYYQFIHDMQMISIDHQPIFNGRMLLMEDPKVTFERGIFLKKMKEIRQSGLNIYYISERIIDNDFKFPKPWIRNCKSSKLVTHEHVFFHAITKQGFTNGIFCYSPTEYDFYKWIIDILIPLLKTASVIVFDNSPLHGTPKPNKISIFDTTDEMRQWLRENNIPHTDSMKKFELYRLIENCVCNLDQSAQVDRVIKANGHQVMRLPINFEYLSPIDQIWQNILKFQSVSRTDIHNDIVKYFFEIPATAYDLLYKNVEEKKTLCLNWMERLIKLWISF
ncbi:hypothetical protein HF086_002144 [Spodoptera exigua]|uniref:Uncharacterized protein n=1 Tax=Spodoptera exigua TaxID=7107 RepID=A0A922SJ19_SPOEX|nr:hypothetical protein HF086_002144 [Spodoptera exigua]